MKLPHTFSHFINAKDLGRFSHRMAIRKSFLLRVLLVGLVPVGCCVDNQCVEQTLRACGIFVGLYCECTRREESSVLIAIDLVPPNLLYETH